MYIEHEERIPRRSRNFARRSRTGEGSFLGTVFAWMASGLALSAGVAHWLSTRPDLMAHLFDGAAGVALLLIPFAIILLMAVRLNDAGPIEVILSYLLLTGIMGSWLTGIAVQVNEDPAFARVVFQALLTTVVMFGGMALTGWVSRRDLTGLGTFLGALLWGLIGVGLVNTLMVQSEGVAVAYHVAGVVIFAGLTAYDVQKIKEHYRHAGSTPAAAIWGALALYLDFLNLFLHLLSLMGRSNKD